MPSALILKHKHTHSVFIHHINTDNNTHIHHTHTYTGMPYIQHTRIANTHTLMIPNLIFFVLFCLPVLSIQ